MESPYFGGSVVIASDLKGTSKLLWGLPGKMLGGNLRWTSIPSRRSRNIPSRFVLQKPEIISAGLMGLWLAQSRLGQTLPFTLF